MWKALADLGRHFAQNRFGTNESNTHESSSDSDSSSTDESDAEALRMAALANDDDPEATSEVDEADLAPEIPNIVSLKTNFERKPAGALSCQSRGGCTLGCASKMERIEEIRASMLQLATNTTKFIREPSRRTYLRGKWMMQSADTAKS
jgi:hypothetical protein